MPGLSWSIVMAITSLDGILAGVLPPEDFYKVGPVVVATVGRWHSYFYADGRPGAAVAPASGLAGAALTAYAGQLPWTNPSSGNSYLARVAATVTGFGQLVLADRLWHNSGIVVTTTTAQTLNSVGWPARDRDGVTNGESVLIGLEVVNGLGNIAVVSGVVISYTNQAGTSGRTGTMESIPVGTGTGAFFLFSLQAGDTGVRSVQSITLGTNLSSGDVSLVAYRRLATVLCTRANVGAALDAIATGFVRLYNNTVPFLLWLASTTAPPDLHGQAVVAQG